MEDQKVLKAFDGDSILDSIQEMKDFISKDLAECRSMLLEVLGEKATSSEPPNTVTNAKLWQFGGKNPEAWIVQAEHYFDFHKIEEDQKLNVASFYLDGEALKWYQWLFRNNQLIDWPHFSDKVRIQFKQKGFESTGGRFSNLEQVTYVTEYQNCCEDSLGESGLLFPSHTYVHPQWRNITNSVLSQYNGEQSECKRNTNAHKVFGESSDRHKDANSLCTSSKPIEFFITPNDLVSSVSKIENSCGDDVENEDKNEEEEIVSIRNKPIEFVIANANKPSFWINSVVSTTCDLSMFDICKALDDHWNQLFAYPFGLAQRWEEMPSIPYPFNYAKLMRKVTNDGRNWNYVGCFIILSLDMSPELVECDGYDLKCLGSQSNLVGKGIILHVWDPGIHRQFVKLNNLNSGILFHIQTQDALVNIKQLKRPICVLTVHQRESFLVVVVGIEKGMARCWNSQKVDHQQLFEIFEQEHEHVLAKWTTERCGKYRWVEDLDAYANVDENVIFDIALVKWQLLYSLQRIDQEDKEDTILVKATLDTYPGVNKFAVMISILFPNLEDKVCYNNIAARINKFDAQNLLECMRPPVISGPGPSTE
ncbi:hypothetical protein KY290_024188 [Solanum tuberosum]|uniref:Retrotransposon gag domain-containing protein n=1 Tax=Solanum tuberosum TaxID=4113 RepID=A0ABQ7UQ02_SOLTU|nr:hypothetical protein KY290_024188 [Solanum tuberosum]